VYKKVFAIAMLSALMIEKVIVMAFLTSMATSMVTALRSVLVTA
jgi:hypothetical protein